MKKNRKMIIEPYIFDEDYCVDMVQVDGYYEVYLYHKDSSVKELILGVSKEDYNYQDFINDVKYALLNDTYIEDYILKYGPIK